MRRLILLLFLAQSVLAVGPVGAQSIIAYNDVHHPLYGKAGMVAAQHLIAAEIGSDVLADGGNAVDAAVAVGFALAVTLPRAGNIGGGGFMLVYDAESGKTTAIDYREIAPLGATRDMFLDENGDADPRKSNFSHLAAGVPGTVAGLYAAHNRYGTLPWKSLLKPAAEMAREGIVVSYDLSNKLAENRDWLSNDAATAAYFFKADGSPYAAGELLVQADLADTLEHIANDGADAFYKGPIADKIVAEMESGGGLINKQALASYEVAFREPVSGTYRDYRIVSMPPSSSGGVHVIQMLNILENFPVAELGAGSADNLHLLTEVARLAFADRSEHLGDTDYYEVPLDWLMSKQYARELAGGIDMQHARPSADVKPGVAPLTESADTTHFSIMDSAGNTVANTFTLNASYGSGISVAGAGFLLNNEMDDFVSKPGVANAFGMLGGDANAVEAHKRPLSSMTPVIVFKDGKAHLATGCPGGPRIITAVLQLLVNVIDHEMNIADATNAPQMHHQWYPDQLALESGFGADTVRELERRGHKIRGPFGVSSLQTVRRSDGLFRGAADPRRPGAAAAGPGGLNY